MSEAKKRSEQHLIDADGELLLRSFLPRHWVLRSYRPDYGIDFSLEAFRPPTKAAKSPATYETLGEHIFIQLKTVASINPLPLQLYERVNVEKQPEIKEKAHPVGVLNTIRFQIDTSELVTIERMGVGVPVLLVIAALANSSCYFVCLNDYIDKILFPRYGDYTKKAMRTIHVPIVNELGSDPLGQTALRWYGKRPKLYAAFQRFVFQAAELRYALDSPEGVLMARYFASRIARYDFWNDTDMWAVIEQYGRAVRRVLSDGRSNLTRDESAKNGRAQTACNTNEQMPCEELLELWRRLSLLPRIYEDVCREWLLPTALGIASSFPSGTTEGGMKPNISSSKSRCPASNPRCPS